MDPCRQVKASQPWFFVLPGTAGLERVAVSMCPASLFLQVALVCWYLTPQPWDEQKPPTIRKLYDSFSLG